MHRASLTWNRIIKNAVVANDILPPTTLSLAHRPRIQYDKEVRHAHHTVTGTVIRTVAPLIDHPQKIAEIDAKKVS